MEVVAQGLTEILASLSPLAVEWQDETSQRAIARLEALSIKPVYTVDDVGALLDEGRFNDGLLICRLFLGLSKDQFEAALKAALQGKGCGEGCGVTRYRKEPKVFVDALSELGLVAAMTAEVNRQPRWSDSLVERLRSGRGSAISGQKRGRGVEDFAEKIVQSVFGDQYDKRCTFTGVRGRGAKCDFAIPSRSTPRIVVEAKGYGATGSKMTDILGDIKTIVDAKRPDTTFLFFTDGVSWTQRQSDLRKIIQYQNDGDIVRIYTSATAAQFRADLEQLKAEYRI